MVDPAPEQIRAAQRIQEMADKPIDDLLRWFRIMKWPTEYQVIVLEAVAHKAMREIRRMGREVDDA